MPEDKATAKPRVLLAGASGLVGRALAAHGLGEGAAAQLHLLVRSPLSSPGSDARVQQHVVRFAALPALPAADWALCALGTTIKQVESQEAFRAVDLGAVVAFAQAALAAGVRRFGVVSALGADAGSRVFYNRVKGEMEAAVAALPFERVVIAQPSLLAGDRSALGQPSRTMERLTLLVTGGPMARLLPASVRPIEAATVARALWRAVADEGGGPGVRRLRSGELQRLGC
jgi:uncharacterized protein YbjT (DUF2867 family)